MKALALLLLLGAAPVRAAVETQADLTPGSYSIILSGMICTACAKAVMVELNSLDSVDRARADWERGEVFLTIRPNKYLRFSQLRKALRRASGKANLGNKIEVQAVRYRP